MSKPHPLAGLIANYGDSDDDSDDGIVHTPCAVVNKGTNKCPSAPGQEITPSNVAGIHPAPIPHCPWSACYDESSGFTYYWNQKTNAVTWEAPPEYLLALKIAQQHLHTSGTTEVSAEEWQLYQQALVDKQNSQNKLLARAAIAKISMKPEKPSAPIKEKKTKINKKRPASDDEEERIELITSYHNSDSESNDEAESSVVAPTPPTPKATVRTPKNHKRLKPRAQVEYGPAMPPNLDYSVPIGPELPPNSHNITIPKPPEIKPKPVGAEKQDKAVSNDCEDSQDEGLLLMRLKDKAKLLERLGGELPAELRQMFKDDTGSAAASPKSAEDAAAKISPDIDDLLQEIEKKEFAKTKQETEKEFSKPKTADSNERSDFKDPKSNLSSVANSPRSDGHRTPPLEELKALFPIVKSVAEPVAGAKVVAEPVALFPSANNAELVAESKPPSPVKPEKKNIYLTDVGEKSESRKRPRISNSVLPYTTRYAHVEGPAEPRTGLGFGTDVEGARVPSAESAVSTVSYGGGLTFTRGGTLNGGGSEPAEPAEPAAPDEPDEPALLETRLGQLCDMQPAVVPQLQRMLIELQTLLAARCAGALGAAYVRAWARRACSVLGPLEVAATAAPPGWTCAFHRYAAHAPPPHPARDEQTPNTPPSSGHRTRQTDTEHPALRLERTPHTNDKQTRTPTNRPSLRLERTPHTTNRHRTPRPPSRADTAHDKQTPNTPALRLERTPHTTNRHQTPALRLERTPHRKRQTDTEHPAPALRLERTPHTTNRHRTPRPPSRADTAHDKTDTEHPALRLERTPHTTNRHRTPRPPSRADTRHTDTPPPRLRLDTNEAPPSV
ncbi:unnamed protein product, partial [Iphiclides podalirius]